MHASDRKISLETLLKAEFIIQGDFFGGVLGIRLLPEGVGDLSHELENCAKITFTIGGRYCLNLSAHFSSEIYGVYALRKNAQNLLSNICHQL